MFELTKVHVRLSQSAG